MRYVDSSAKMKRERSCVRGGGCGFVVDAEVVDRSGFEDSRKSPALVKVVFFLRIRMAVREEPLNRKGSEAIVETRGPSGPIPYYTQSRSIEYRGMA